MEYLLLVYDRDGQGERMPAEKRIAFDQACQANFEALRESGYLLAAIDLQKHDKATTLRVVNGRLSLEDNSNPWVGERLNALFFISARDFNEAIRLAARMSQAVWGAIEVRALDETFWGLEKNTLW